MAQNTPPSPTPSAHNGLTLPMPAEALPNGFDELVQHNAVTSHPTEPVAMDTIKAEPISRYGTPAPRGYDAVDQYSYPTQSYSQDSSPYGPIPDEIHVGGSQGYSTPATSPPTPSRASDVITTRSGMRVLRNAHTPPRSKALAPRSSGIEKSKKSSTKKRKGKDDKKIDGAAILDQPLSVTSKTFAAKMEEIRQFVERGTEERQAEIMGGKTPGKVKRPMNAFMLYRKAFHADAQEQHSQPNHQILSQLTGQSWKLEPQDTVRDLFIAWANTERENHRRAFPDYKFSPTKPAKARGKDREHDDGSDLEDFEWERGANRSQTRTPNLDRMDPDADYIPPRGYHSPVAYHVQDFPGMHHGGGAARSTFQYSNPGKPMPGPYEHHDLGGDVYYQTQVRRQGPGGAIEDVAMRKTPSPAAMFGHPGHQLHPSPYGQHVGGMRYEMMHNGWQAPSPYSPQAQYPGQHQYPAHMTPHPHHGMPHMLNMPVQVPTQAPAAVPYEQRIDPSLLQGAYPDLGLNTLEAQHSEPQATPVPAQHAPAQESPSSQSQSGLYYDSPSLSETLEFDQQFNNSGYVDLKNISPPDPQGDDYLRGEPSEWEVHNANDANDWLNPIPAQPAEGLTLPALESGESS